MEARGGHWGQVARVLQDASDRSPGELGAEWAWGPPVVELLRGLRLGVRARLCLKVQMSAGRRSIGAGAASPHSGGLWAAEPHSEQKGKLTGQ